MAERLTAIVSLSWSCLCTAHVNVRQVGQQPNASCTWACSVATYNVSDTHEEPRSRKPNELPHTEWGDFRNSALIRRNQQSHLGILHCLCICVSGNVQNLNLLCEAAPSGSLLIDIGCSSAVEYLESKELSWLAEMVRKTSHGRYISEGAREMHDRRRFT